jgi:WD40 repeat protein
MLSIVLLLFAAGPVNGPLPPGAIAQLGDMRFNQGGLATFVAFSGDGLKLLSVCEYPQGLTVWDLKTGKLLQDNVGGRDASLHGLAAHPRNGTVLWREDDHLVLWDLESRKAVWKVPTSDYSPCWGRGGRCILAEGLHSGLAMWDGRDGKVIKRIGGRGIAAASPVRYEAVLLNGELITLVDLHTRKLRWQASSPSKTDDLDAHAHVAFDWRGEWVLAGGPGPDVRLWRARDGKPGPALGKGPADCRGVGFTRDGRAVVAFANGLIRTFSPANGKELRRWNTAPELTQLAVSPHGQIVATAYRYRPHLHLWDSRTGKRHLAPIGHGDAIMGVEFKGDGELVTRALSGRVKKWSLATGNATPQPSRPATKPGLKRRVDARFVAENDSKGLSLIDRKTGKCLLLLKADRDHKITSGLSGDCRWLAGVSARVGGPGLEPDRFAVWELKTGKKRLERNDIFTWQFSPDARRLALICRSGLQVFDLGRLGGKPLLQAEGEVEEGFSWLQWSASGRLLAAGEGEILVLDARKGATLWRLEIPDGPVPVLAARFSPDERLLAVFSGSNGGYGPDGFQGKSVTVYSAESGKVLHRFRGHRGGITDVAFSPRGDTLATCSVDATVLLWDLTGRMRRPCPLTASSFGACWEKLLLADSVETERAFWEIVYCPQGPAFLRKVVRPQRGMAAEQLKKHVAGLDSDDFETRRRSEAALLAHGPGGTGALARAMAMAPSLDVRLRIERVLRRWATTPEARRLSRALMVLEKSGTAEAKALLKELACGEPGAPATEDAKAALKRLGAKP